MSQDIRGNTLPNILKLKKYQNYEFKSLALTQKYLEKIIYKLYS